MEELDPDKNHSNHFLDKIEDGWLNILPMLCVQMKFIYTHPLKQMSLTRIVKLCASSFFV